MDLIHIPDTFPIQRSKKARDKLVWLISDKWLARKKGNPSRPSQERVEIVKNLQMVDDVLCWDDDDDSVPGAIFKPMVVLIQL